ncbi:hypothetical protein BC940DRAFT_297826 [Gongronella butleri]|nr:hypothetical protein BC940DRAFT_297826 [Gongronella butleri]
MNDMTHQFQQLDLEKVPESMEGKMTRMEIDNAYLSQQNRHLERELSFARYTINAFKTIAQQKETTLQETQMELERAYLRIKMLGISMMRQQELLLQQQRQMNDDKPTLIMDLDSSDDQHELSDEEEDEEPPRTRPFSNIMAKLPLRQSPPTMVFDPKQQQSAPPLAGGQTTPPFCT